MFPPAHSPWFLSSSRQMNYIGHSTCSHLHTYGHRLLKFQQHSWTCFFLRVYIFLHYLGLYKIVRSLWEFFLPKKFFLNP